MPTSGGQKTYSCGILWDLPGLWKANLCSTCFRLSPKTEVHWKMLSLLGGSSIQSFLFALSQNPVSQSRPVVWAVHWAMLKPICITDFSPRDQYACIGRCFHQEKKEKKKKCEEVHLFMNAIRERVRWLKTRFCMSWDNAAVSSSPYSLDPILWHSSC